MIIAGLVVVSLCIVTYFIIWKKNSKFSEMIDRFPGPKTVPIFGNLLQMKGDGGMGMYATVLRMATQSYRECGMFRLWFANKPVIVAYKPEYLEAIFNSSMNTKKSVFYNMLRPWLQDGLLMSYGPKWQSRRKQLTPTFHYSILESFVPIFDAKACTLVDILDSKVNGEAIDIHTLFTNCTLDIICDTAMGVDINAQLNLDTAYIKALHRISDIILDRMQSTWAFNDTLFSLTPRAREHKQMLDVLHSFTTKVIEERLAEIQHSKEESETNGPSSDDKVSPSRRKVKRPAFLDLLLASNAENGLTIDELRAEVDTFMFEGHDTTAAALTWAIYYLAVNKDCQEKAREEVQAIFGNDKLTDMTRLKNLKYLECCLKESMRLLPPVPWYGREVTHEFKLGDNNVPIGATISILATLTHRDPTYFPDPEEFLPERWSEDSLNSRHPFCYIPFSAGVRNCIGQKFAMLEEKVILSNILRKFEISCDQTLEEIDPQGLLVLRPAAGMFVTLKRIKDSAI